LAIRRTIYDQRRYGHFLTFSCYRRARLLDGDRAKGIVVHYLEKQLKNQKGSLAGFVVMPDHVHALVRFQEPGVLSVFMNQWKRRSSMALKKHFQERLKAYESRMGLEGSAVWQPKYYSFEVFSRAKVLEKLEYMHNNPVKSGLVAHAKEWVFGSAPWYLSGRPVGVPIEPLG